MFEEEHRGTTIPETVFEVAVRAHWTGLGFLALLGAGGNAEWSRAALAAIGLLGPCLFLGYYYSTDRPPSRIGRRYLLLMIPALTLILAFVVSTAFPAFTLHQLGQRQVWAMLPLPPTWVPVSGQLIRGLIGTLMVAGLYASALNAEIISQGRMVHARTWAGLVLVAGLLAVLGLTQWATHADSILWFISIDNPQFFSVFPLAAHWSAFALLWMGAALGLVAWLVGQRGWRWLSGDGWILLGCAAVLAASIAVAGEPLHWLLGALVAAVGCFGLAWQSFRERKPGSRADLGASLSVVAGVACVLVALGVFFSHGNLGWIKYDTGNRNGLSVHDQVVADTISMWRARPWFGWGGGSFAIVHSFFQQADQNTDYWVFARSDLWQNLAEYGLIGTAVWILPIIWVAVRLLRARRLASFLFAPLAGVIALGALTAVDFPFASPAVFFSFWLLLLALPQWSQSDDETSKSTWSDKQRAEIRRRKTPTITKPPVFAPPAPPAKPAAPAASDSNKL